uniref:YqaJ viral recombinase domain-containing protein n=1 Tax=Schizaphis graminum TaxID=13262 RepID=A0A2S2NJI8_SCHGA
MYCDIKTTGLAILQDFPIFGASADGIAADFVLEIKCPINHKTMINYIKNDIIQPKVLSQIQIQMHNKSKGLLAIADPDFNINKKLQLKWFEYDYVYCEKLIKKSSLLFLLLFYC